MFSNTANAGEMLRPAAARDRISNDTGRITSKRKIRVAILDWDGTVSLTCEGWHVITAPLMVSIIMGTEFSEEEWRMLAESAAREGRTEKITSAIQRLIDRGRINRELWDSVMHYLDDNMGTTILEDITWAVERAEEHGRRFLDREEFLRKMALSAQHEVDDINNPASIRSLRLKRPLDDIAMPGAIDRIKQMHRDGIRVRLASAAPQETVETEVRRFGLSEYIRPEDIRGDRGTPDSVKSVSIARIVGENSDIIKDPSEVLICGDGSVEIRVGSQLGATLVGVAGRDKPGVSEKLRRAGAQFIIEDFVQGARLLDAVVNDTTPGLLWSGQVEETAQRSIAFSVLRPAAARDKLNNLVPFINLNWKVSPKLNSKVAPIMKGHFRIQSGGQFGIGNHKRHKFCLRPLASAEVPQGRRADLEEDPNDPNNTLAVRQMWGETGPAGKDAERDEIYNLFRLDPPLVMEIRDIKTWKRLLKILHRADDGYIIGLTINMELAATGVWEMASPSRSTQEAIQFVFDQYRTIPLERKLKVFVFGPFEAVAFHEISHTAMSVRAIRTGTTYAGEGDALFKGSEGQDAIELRSIADRYSDTAEAFSAVERALRNYPKTADLSQELFAWLCTLDRYPDFIGKPDMPAGSEEAEYLRNYMNPANKSAIVMLRPARRFITVARRHPDIIEILRGYCERLGTFTRAVKFLPSLDMGASYTFTSPFSSWSAAPLELSDDRQTLQSVLRALAARDRLKIQKWIDRARQMLANDALTAQEAMSMVEQVEKDGFAVCLLRAEGNKENPYLRGYFPGRTFEAEFNRLEAAIYGMDADEVAQERTIEAIDHLLGNVKVHACGSRALVLVRAHRGSQGARGLELYVIDGGPGFADDDSDGIPDVLPALSMHGPGAETLGWGLPYVNAVSTLMEIETGGHLVDCKTGAIRKTADIIQGTAVRAVIFENRPAGDTFKGRPGPMQGLNLEEYLRRPEVTGTGGKGIRARFLTMAVGGTRSYDALILDGFPHNILPELKEGLSSLLYRFEQEAAAVGGGWTWLDLATGLATAPKEAMKMCPHMRPVLVDVVRWARSDLPLEDAAEVEQKAGSVGIRDVWSVEGLDFIQADAGEVEIPKDERCPIRVATMFQALSYNRDPLKILAHVYNQLPVGAYFLFNFYIPTEYDAAKLGIPMEYAQPENLMRFWEEVIQDLRDHGIPVDLLAQDLRVKYTPAQGYGNTNFPELHLGLVIQRVPVELDLRLTACSVPVQVIGGRLVEYQFAWYNGNLAEPFAYRAFDSEISSGPLSPNQEIFAIESCVLRPGAVRDRFFP